MKTALITGAAQRIGEADSNCKSQQINAINRSNPGGMRQADCVSGQR